ncbi:MAG: hypothetical protein LC627_04695, partial [Verrucomicrobiaceae bacterium]|nr:hypothetical protein [Verrucomicrobiaceae bacterium]
AAEAVLAMVKELRKGTDIARAREMNARLQTIEGDADKLELEGGWHVEDDFIAAVKSKGRVRPHPDFEEGFRYMRVVQAVADSRARNEWVEIRP